ncbi:MAG: porin family protein [Raineya sp.]|jgi:hypothetical protein|nr:porin family protein [Raineya sp.]
MKNKTVLFTFLFIISVVSVNAQRHVKGVSQIELGGGITGKGLFGQVGYLRHFNNKIFGEAQFFGESSTIKGDVDGSDVKYSSYALNLQVGYNLWNNEKIFFNAKAGLAGGLESGKLVSKPINYIGSDDKSGSFVAGTIGGEVEFFVSDKFMVVPHFSQWFLVSGGSNFGTARYFAGLSFRFGINQ